MSLNLRKPRTKNNGGQFHVAFEDILPHTRYAIGNHDASKIAVRKCAVPDGLYAGQLHGRQPRISKGASSDGIYVIGYGIRTRQARRISNQVLSVILEQNTVLHRKGYVPRHDVIGHHGHSAIEGRAVYFLHLGRDGKRAHLNASLEGISSDADQLAVFSKDHRGKSDVIAERRAADLGHTVGNGYTHQIGAIHESTVADPLQVLGENDLSKGRVAAEGILSDGGDLLSLNGIGNGDVSSMTRISTDLDGAVLKLHVNIGDAVLLVYPVGVQGQIGRKLVLVPHVLLRTLRIVVPAVKHGVQPLRNGHILQSMVANKYLLPIVQFVGHHVERDSSALLQNQRAYVQCTVTVIPIGPQLTQIIAGCPQHLLHRKEFRVRIPCHIQGDSTRHDGR